MGKARSLEKQRKKKFDKKENRITASHATNLLCGGDGSSAAKNLNVPARFEGADQALWLFYGYNVVQDIVKSLNIFFLNYEIFFNDNNVESLILIKMLCGGGGGGACCRRCRGCGCGMYMCA